MKSSTTFMLAMVASLLLASCGSSPTPPSTTKYTIGGTVSGLSGTGLVLQNNGGNNLPVTANGAFTFTTSITSGDPYSVTVSTQPSSPTQTCTVSSGSGTATANVTNVQVTCTTPTYTIGGAVSGLSGTGLVLQNNGGNNLAVSANGSFTFATAIASGHTYSVTVLTQPSSPAQMCTVSNGSGTVGSANVTNVQVACATLYTIGGTVTNLAGTGGGLQLQDNGRDSLLINANGAFTFATAIASGSTYTVTVFVQPSAPAQLCAVTNGTGTVTANVTNVVIDCSHNAQWTWEGGSNILDQPGVYGTQGTPAAANVPGARAGSVSWTDAAGNFWLFGGQYVDSITDPLNPKVHVFNDLWKYSAGQWTWVGGSNLMDQNGTYGTKGTAAPANIPGARTGSISWLDASGNLWLFGGVGYDSTATLNDLNDLWKYSAGQWTWMGGSNLAAQAGTYGTLGTPAAGNTPGARDTAASWIDASGNLWLFGGLGYDSTGALDGLNDLWKYSGGQWTWVGGSNLVDQNGTYGTLGTPAPGNIPGARTGAATWTDPAGNFWLFGGLALDAGLEQPGPNEEIGNDLNDLWKYSAGQWTWMGGSSVAPGSVFGVYGTQGTPAPANIPGGREGAVVWTDGAGNVWLFGGVGYASQGGDDLGDLWKYSAGQWTWLGGANTIGQLGTYGTLGTGAPGNIPGGRQHSAHWMDATGNFWLFGGYGYSSTGTIGSTDFLNDLWKYGF